MRTENIVGISENIVGKGPVSEELGAGEFRQLFLSLLGSTNIDMDQDLVRAEVKAAEKTEIKKEQVASEQTSAEQKPKEQNVESRQSKEQNIVAQENREQNLQKEQQEVANNKQATVSKEQENNTGQQATDKEEAVVENSQPAAVKQEVASKEVKQVATTTPELFQTGATQEEATNVKKIVLPSEQVKAAVEKNRATLEFEVSDKQPVKSQQTTQTPESVVKSLEQTLAAETKEHTYEAPRTRTVSLTKGSVSAQVEDIVNAQIKDAPKKAPLQEPVAQALGIQNIVTTTAPLNHHEAQVSPKGASISTFSISDKSERAALNFADRPSILQRARTQIVENIQKVVDAIAAGKTGNTLTVRLDPPELGKVTVKVSSRKDTLYAKIVPESKEVEGNLKSRVHELGALLNLAGVKATNFEIAVAEAEQAPVFGEFLNEEYQESSNDSSYSGSGGHGQHEEQENELTEGWVA